MGLRWVLTFQQRSLPTSIRREDGSPEGPPSGLIRYIEIAKHGPWTMDAATDPLAMMWVEYPRECPRPRCPGSMIYVEHLRTHVMADGSPNPHGWQCDTCAQETDEAGGFAMVID
jgi:hypothetical protein